MIRVTDVPDRTHLTLKSRAAREGMSLSDFIRRELERSVERPTMQEWLEHTAQLRPLGARRSATRVVRELRNSR